MAAPPLTHNATGCRSRESGTETGVLIVASMPVTIKNTNADGRFSMALKIGDVCILPGEEATLEELASIVEVSTDPKMIGSHRTQRSGFGRGERTVLGWVCSCRETRAAK